MRCVVHDLHVSVLHNRIKFLRTLRQKRRLRFLTTDMHTNKFVYCIYYFIVDPLSVEDNVSVRLIQL